MLFLFNIGNLSNFVVFVMNFFNPEIIMNLHKLGVIIFTVIVFYISPLPILFFINYPKQYVKLSSFFKNKLLKK